MSRAPGLIDKTLTQDAIVTIVELIDIAIAGIEPCGGYLCTEQIRVIGRRQPQVVDGVSGQKFQPPIRGRVGHPSQRGPIRSVNIAINRALRGDHTETGGKKYGVI